MLNISLNLYRIFCIVAQSKSYADASEKLNITPSTISSSIKKLEEQLDNKLFDRNNDGVTLTKVGQELFELIDEQIETIDFAEKIMLDKTDLSNGEITIGCQSHIAIFYLMDYIEKAKKDYPNLKIKLIGNTNADEIFELMKIHKVDFIVSNVVPSESNYGRKIICKDLENMTNILVSKKPIKINELKQLEQFKYILSCDYTYTNKFFKEALRKNQVEIKTSMECDITEVRIEAVKRGLGIGYVMKDTVKKELQNKELYEVELPIELPGVNIKLAYNKGQLTKVARSFINKYLQVNKN